MSQLLDFGNGVVAGNASDDAVILMDQSGLEYPEVVVPTVEGAVTDGGLLGTSRAKMRRMTALLDFGTSKTRVQVAALFAPGVLRTLSSTRGSMPYTVEVLGFARPNLSGSVQASVTMVSEYAYPEYTLQSASLAASGTVASLADVDCAPIFTVTLGFGGASGVVITTPGCVTTILGAMVAADVLVVDSSAHTVTVNNVNRLNWFDRTGRWPRLTAGNNAVSIQNSVGANVPTVVTWYPRVMGLL